MTGSSGDVEFRVGLTEKGTFEQRLVGGWRRSHISDWGGVIWCRGKKKHKVLETRAFLADGGLERAMWLGQCLRDKSQVMRSEWLVPGAITLRDLELDQSDSSWGGRESLIMNVF